MTTQVPTRLTGWPPIAKPARPWPVEPNLGDYEQACATFTWDAARRLLSGLPDRRGLNIAYEAVDRHGESRRGNHVAIRAIARDGHRRDITYTDLQRQTAAFAHVLRRLGVKKGEVVATLLGRTPDLYVAALGTLKHGSVYAPLLTALGPEPVAARLAKSRARVLVTSVSLYQRKVARIRPRLEVLEHVLLVRDSAAGLPRRTKDLAALVAAASDTFEIPPTDPQDPAILHFTSGTMGSPKAALHVHEAVVAHHLTAAYALDLHAEDVFWCTADPGWVTGTSYGIIAPLTHGATLVVDEADFDAERSYQVLQDERVSVWYTVPAAVRSMIKAGTPLARSYDYPALRFLGSVGEPLNPAAVLWGQEAFGHPFHDNWWQTETGGIMIANFAALPIRPGSMGLPLPGIDAAVVRRHNGAVVPIDAPDVVGELALRAG
jgi:acetyl-CoA synthetase